MIQESLDQAVTLQDDRPEVVGLMLDYFYDLDYRVGARITQDVSELEIHACVYGIGEKHGSEGLKTLAKKKFGEYAPTAAATHQNFLSAIRPIFSMTPSSDRGLRDMAVNTWLFIAAGAEEERKDEVEAIMLDVPDFARNIAMRLAPLCSKVLLQGICHCGQDTFGSGESLFEARCFNCKRPAKEAVKLFVRPYVEIEAFW